MTKINHYDLSRVLGSQIVGAVNVGHGQLECSRVTQSVNASRTAIAATELHDDVPIDASRVVELFKRVRERRGDSGSPDLYIADRTRNMELVDAWRAAKVAGSVARLNRTLLNARKVGLLKGIKSSSYTLPRDVVDRLRFVCEFVATKLRYETGSSVDDIICDPGLSDEFHRRCQAIVPGYDWLDYRWTLLGVRKAGRKVKIEGRKQLIPDFNEHPINFTDEVEIGIVNSKLDSIHTSRGVFSLAEGNRDLYVSGSNNLRSSIEHMAQPAIVKATKESFWTPIRPLVFRYVPTPDINVKAAEEWLIEQRQPVFNVPRRAA